VRVLDRVEQPGDIAAGHHLNEWSSAPVRQHVLGDDAELLLRGDGTAWFDVTSEVILDYISNSIGLDRFRWERLLPSIKSLDHLTGDLAALGDADITDASNPNPTQLAIAVTLADIECLFATFIDAHEVQAQLRVGLGVWLGFHLQRSHHGVGELLLPGSPLRWLEHLLIHQTNSPANGTLTSAPF
jgi:hypothetical protein